MDEIYPGSRDEFVDGATIAWGEERYTRGVVLGLGAGAVHGFWPALRGSYGRVYFAGEHTDLYASYMEGAVRSGRRVAERDRGARRVIEVTTH